ncbi:MAG: NAD(P)H-dependent amine dehydrogenase family protein [Marmoricola sp.]
MTIRVVHVATGNAGRIALRHLIGDARFELVGVVVSNPEKVGKDAAELCGAPAPTGVTAVDDLAAALDLKPDCVSYCALSETRFFEALEDIKTCLASGANVVTTSPVTLMYPWGLLSDSMIDPFEDLCRNNGVSLFATGVDPGWANDLLPLAIASTCQSVEQIRCSEIADYASYSGAPVIFEVMGFGREPAALDNREDMPMLFKPGMLTAAWGVALRQLATAFGFELDEIRESVEQEPAPVAFDVAAGHIPAGGVAAVRFQIIGVASGKEVLVIDHTTRLDPTLRPDWPQPAHGGGGYRVEIVGEPSYLVDVTQSTAFGDHNDASIASGAGRMVNAIPAVVAAEPGIRTLLDLPLNTAKGVFAATLATNGDS